LANTLRTTGSVTFSPAISAVLTMALSASRAELACTVQENPQPAFDALVSSKASAPRY